MYQHPGVYIEEIPSGSAPIEAASTSTALIVGYATKGPAGTPTLLFNFDQYASQFGGIVDFSKSTLGQTVDYMGHSVQAFFNNGGTKAYIVRLEGAGATPAAAKLIIPVQGATTVGNLASYFSIKAVNSGVWANGLEIRAVPTGASPPLYTISVGRIDRQGNFVASETFTDVSFDPTVSAAYVSTQINGVSSLIKVDPASATSTPPLGNADKLPFQVGSLTSGDLSVLVPSTVAGMKVEVAVNGGTAVDVTFSTTPPPASLGDVAKQIQNAVLAASGTAASGKFTFSAQPSPNSSISVGGTPFTFVTALTTGNQIQIATTNLAATIANAAIALNASTVTAVAAATYSTSGGDTINIVYDTVGPIGNSFATTASTAPASNATAFGATLTGGTAAPVTANFTCTVESMKLVLRSGVNGSAAAVAVTAPTNTALDATAGLKLDAANTTSLTGDQAFVQAFQTASSATLASGVDGMLPGLTDYTSLIGGLKKFRDMSIIFLPGQVWPDNQDIISAFVGHAEDMKNRMVIIDPRPRTEFITSNDVIAAGFPSSTYTVAYYPWLEVSNPWYQAELRPDRPRTVFLPPSGFAAGLWAKTDGRRGVWKAPAGLQASLLGAASTQFKVGDDEQDQLNPAGLNCYRRIISDIVVWGSRTLATKTDPEWRYVPVRRTAMMIEESIYEGIQWAVFEPNDHRLWSSLRLNIGAFMDSLFRAGAFQGDKASSAYFIRCGLGDTMTQGDIDAGQVIAVVGFAPLKPAEFVIVRIQQIVGKS